MNLKVGSRIGDATRKRWIDGNKVHMMKNVRHNANSCKTTRKQETQVRGINMRAVHRSLDTGMDITRGVVA